MTNRKWETTRSYRDAAERAAAESKTVFVDLFDGRFDKLDLLLSDGLHLTPEGNDILFQAVLEALPKSVLSIPPAFPHWAKLLERK